jgi:copper chaperone CopZ
MNSIKKGLMAITLLLSAVVATAQIKNAKTESVKIFGNCGMCESKIEKAGNQKDIASVDWDKDSKMATVTYDSKTTNKNEILKRIAAAGYDSEEFHAEDAAYTKLPGCCQYDRAPSVKEENKSTVDKKTKK